MSVLPTPSPAEAVEPPPSSEPDPLDKLLAQWDDEQKGNGAAADLGSDYTDDELARLLGDANQQAAARQQRDAEWQAFQQQTAQQQADASIAVAARDQQIGELQQTVGQLQGAIQQEVQRQHQQRSLQDFERLISSEQQKLADVTGIDEDHAKRWMLAEAAQDPGLREAWEARYYQPPGPVERARIAGHIQQWGENQAKLALQLPDARARVLAQQNIEASMRQMWETAFPDPATYRANAARYVNRALDRMHKDARRPRVDPDVTADRLAVVQAMRGASGKPPPEPPLNLGRMTAGEFARHAMEKYGF